jgi:hypothetical protein
MFAFVNNKTALLPLMLPTNVQAFRTSPTTILVTWNPPAAVSGLQFTQITGYRIYYRHGSPVSTGPLAVADPERWSTQDVGLNTVTEVRTGFSNDVSFREGELVT